MFTFNLSIPRDFRIVATPPLSDYMVHRVPCNTLYSSLHHLLDAPCCASRTRPGFPGPCAQRRREVSVREIRRDRRRRDVTPGLCTSSGATPVRQPSKHRRLERLCNPNFCRTRKSTCIWIYVNLHFSCVPVAPVAQQLPSDVWRFKFTANYCCA